MLETDGSGTTLASYVVGGKELLSQTRGGVTSYYLHDGQGSVRDLTGSNGAVTDSYSYTAFGELYDQTGTTVNPYLYTGQQFDPLTGLYSLRARYYEPQIGRFVSRDTLNASVSNPYQINRYAYTENNPVNAVDPTGNQAFTEYSISNENAEVPAAEEVASTGLSTDCHDKMM